MSHASSCTNFTEITSICASVDNTVANPSKIVSKSTSSSSSSSSSSSTSSSGGGGDGAGGAGGESNPDKHDIENSGAPKVKRVAIIGTPFGEDRCDDREMSRLSRLAYQRMMDVSTFIIQSHFNLEKEQVRLVGGGSAWGEHVPISLYGQDKGQWNGIDLYLYPEFSLAQRSYVETKSPADISLEKTNDETINHLQESQINPGLILNQKHKLFTCKLGEDTLGHLEKIHQEHKLQLHSPHQPQHQQQQNNYFSALSEADEKSMRVSLGHKINPKVSIHICADIKERNQKIFQNSDIVIAFSFYGDGMEEISRYPNPKSSMRQLYESYKHGHKCHISLTPLSSTMPSFDVEEYAICNTQWIMGPGYQTDEHVKSYYDKVEAIVKYENKDLTCSPNHAMNTAGKTSKIKLKIETDSNEKPISSLTIRNSGHGSSDSNTSSGINGSIATNTTTPTTTTANDTNNTSTRKRLMLRIESSSDSTCASSQASQVDNPHKKRKLRIEEAPSYNKETSDRLIPPSYPTRAYKIAFS
jgi:hypothetical protein